MSRQFNNAGRRYPENLNQEHENTNVNPSAGFEQQADDVVPLNGRPRMIKRGDFQQNAVNSWEHISTPSQEEPDDPVVVPAKKEAAKVTYGNFPKLAEKMEIYEINPARGPSLEVLSECDVVVLCDDSGSMKTPVDTGVKTRWDELQQIVTIVVDVCSAICSKGVDVCFLNRNPVLNVKNPESIKNAFVKPPRGLTPLSPTLRSILSGKKNLPDGRKLLILIATDGAPTDPKGEVDIDTLESILKNERAPNVHVTFLACTDDLNAVNYLNGWDETMSNLDVVDDYISERAQVQEAHGAKFPFTFGDYIAKALVGSVDTWLGKLDQKI